MVNQTAENDDIRSTVINCLRGMAKQCPDEFRDETDILHDCDLDSEHGIELACDLSARLGIKIPANENPLVEDRGPSGRKRSRRFGEVLEYLIKLKARSN